MKQLQKVATIFQPIKLLGGNYIEKDEATLNTSVHSRVARSMWW